MQPARPGKGGGHSEFSDARVCRGRNIGLNQKPTEPMVAEKFPELMALPDSEKLQCAAELWASVVGDPVDKDPAMVELIESRLADYRAHPERVVPWSEVKAGLLASRK